jgi:RND family efflux transporter MFP subunit
MKKLVIPSLCFVFLFFCCTKSEPAAPAVVTVKAIKLDESYIKNGLRFSGVIAAGKDIALSFLSPGQVKQVNVNNGDRVEAGALLVVIDSADAQSAYDAAQAKLNQANDAYNRYLPLHNDGNMSDIDWVKVTTARQEARSVFEIAKKTLADCNLTSPSSGYVSEKNIEVGDNVIIGIPVMHIVSLDELSAVVSVPSSEIESVQTGMDVRVRVSALPAFSGKISERGMQADTLTRTYQVKASISNPDTKVLPGMLCNVYIINTNKPALGGTELIIPASALNLAADGSYSVYIVDQASNKVHKSTVTTNGFDEEGIVISSGIKTGDVIVISGTQKLDDGVPVSIQ